MLILIFKIHQIWIFLAFFCFPIIVSLIESHTSLLRERKWSVSCSAVPNSLWSCGLQPTRLLCPWDFPGKDTGVFWPFHLQGISPPKDWTRIFCIAGRFFTNWATREAHSNSLIYFSRHYVIFHSLWLFWFFVLMFLHSCNTYLLGYWCVNNLLNFFPQLMSFIASHRVTFPPFVDSIHIEMYFSFSYRGRHWPTILQTGSLHNIIWIILLFIYFSFDWKIVNDIE